MLSAMLKVENGEGGATRKDVVLRLAVGKSKLWVVSESEGEIAQGRMEMPRSAEARNVESCQAGVVKR